MGKQSKTPDDFRTWKKFARKNGCEIQEGGPHCKAKTPSGKTIPLPRHTQRYGNGLNHAIGKAFKAAGIVVPLLIIGLGIASILGII